jgi:long-chain acyl-CoA synthetase
MTDRLHSFTLGDIVRENSRTLATMTALVCDDAHLTYADIEDRVNRMASVLGELGVERGDRVAWLGLNCHHLFELIFACSKLGAVATPLNWRLTAVEVARIFEDIRPSVVIADGGPDFTEVRSIAAETLPDAPILVHDDGTYEDRLGSVAPVDPERDDDDEMPVLQIMTAAFAGRPKGALLTSRGIVQQNLMHAAVGNIHPVSDVYLGSGPMFHIGVLLRTFAIFHWGGTNVIVPRVEPHELCRLIERERCTMAFLFAPTIRQLVEVNAKATYDLSSLTDAGAGVPPDDVAEAWYGMTSCVPPARPPTMGYGTTETVGMVTYQQRSPDTVGTFGRPSPAMAVRIFDADGHEVAPGQIGEIAVRGPQVMAGYLDQPPLDSTGWRHTGDLGRRELDGGISFLGPNHDMIKTGMENVYPVEVENALREHPQVREACVFGVPDPEWGQSVHAVVEVDTEAAPSSEDLIDFVRTRIASYKKPRVVVVVSVMPRSNGFVDRAQAKALHAQVWQPES